MSDTPTSEPQNTTPTPPDRLHPGGTPLTDGASKRELFFKGFSEQLEAQGVKVAFAFIYDQDAKEPLVFCKGNLYQVTKAAVEFARFMKHKLDEDLTV